MTNTDFTARCMAGKALEDVAGKQDVIADLDTIRAGAAAGATAVQPATLEDYQPKIDSTHKLDADFVEDTNSTNKFATQSQLDQIETNKNNISSILSSQGLLTDTTTIIGTDWTLTTIVLDAPTNAIVDMTVTLIYGEKAPRGIYINRSNISATGGIAKIEDSSNAVQLRLSATGVKLNGVNKYYVWVKSSDTGTSPVYLMYKIYE